MGNQKNRTVRIIMRMMAVITAGILISIAFLANIDTYSWFIGSADGSAQVTAAETEDIIGNFELQNGGKEQNPKAIKIKKSDSIDGDPLVYFSVEGEAANYVLHINPVRLENNCHYIIPIVTDTNLNQFVDLLGREDNITGTLRVKYLNEYIDESYDISFSPKYLMNRLMAKIVNDGAKPENEKIKTMRLSTAVESPEIANENLITEDSEEITIRAIASLAQLVEWRGIDAVLKDEKLSDEALSAIELNLTADQELLMDIIYPGLEKYVEGLKDYIDKLKTEIENKNAELASLDEQLESLESQYDQLLEENARLTEQINNMTPVPAPVQPPPQSSSSSSSSPSPQTPSQPSDQPPVSPGTDTTQPPAADSGNQGTTPPAVEDPSVTNPPAGGNENPPVTEDPAAEQPSTPGENPADGGGVPDAGTPAGEDETPADEGAPADEETTDSGENPPDEGGSPDANLPPEGNKGPSDEEDQPEDNSTESNTNLQDEGAPGASGSSN